MNPNPRHRRDSPRRNRSFAFPLPCNAKANPNTGLTRAPIFPTFTQTFTRCVQVWAVNHQSPEPTALSPAYAALLLAWSAADVVRYAYFGLLQAGIRVDFVKWLRPPLRRSTPSGLRSSTSALLYMFLVSLLLLEMGQGANKRMARRFHDVLVHA
ncbi:hypothetical membrane protein, putative [Aspergillus fumigatus A1163]|uniref:Very-long-chain (3R)-3-hydroxyacyl-CoA dehydratase n=1 Tax=Aspergillus fumigatus (strain CBS 144.89 / FGSC A1163 / CEA10) TaxID=451804 RepID=B0XY13_ASPFC|nr:hypothetical membrane protein, putative [Aspergillus fumigatus A1163]